MASRYAIAGAVVLMIAGAAVSAVGQTTLPPIPPLPVAPPPPPLPPFALPRPTALPSMPYLPPKPAMHDAGGIPSPSPSSGPAGSGLPGYRSTSTFFVQSRANTPLTFLVMNGGRECDSQTIMPGRIMELPICGETLMWHDGQGARSVQISPANAYEFAWSNGRWELGIVSRE